MDRVRWDVGKVIDAHVHFMGVEPAPHFYENIDLGGSAKCAILGFMPGPMNGWLLERKREQPARFYIFGCLHHDPESVAKGDGRYLVRQVERLLASGFDGVKMLEGKPTERKRRIPLPFDHGYYRPFWEFVADRSVPVTAHLADPATSWNLEALRDAYRDDAPFEAYIREAEAVLAAHPNLRISFAHFMYMSPWLDRLDGLFSRYSGMRVDLAMGNEYLYIMSSDPEAARRFFITWQDRILYGTDLHDDNSFRLARAKAETIRLFLETDEVFPDLTSLAMDRPPPVVHGRVDFHGINLPPEVLEKVMALNFERFAGREPRPLPL